MLERFAIVVYCGILLVLTMDKYHIYEEIGNGAFSQVFKGREKKGIEYVAIKRVDKSMMSKVAIY